MALYDSPTAQEELPQEQPAPAPEAPEETQEEDTALFSLGPSQEQLEATSDEKQDIPENLLRASRGEEVVISLPVEEQGGDSLNPPDYTESDEPEKADDES